MWSQVVRGLLSAVLLWHLGVGGVEAAEKKKKAQPPSSPPTPPATAPAPAESPQDKAIKAWLEKLNGTTWPLELRPSGAEQGGPQQDTVTFEGRRVVSNMLTQEGYGGSNFTLTIPDEQTAVWETMQIKSGGERVFWRGEIHGDTMSGILSKQPAQGEPMTWSFTGHTQTPPAPSAPMPTKPSPAPEPSTTAPSTR